MKKEHIEKVGNWLDRHPAAQRALETAANEVAETPGSVTARTKRGLRNAASGLRSTAKGIVEGAGDMPFGTGSWSKALGLNGEEKDSQNQR